MKKLSILATLAVLLASATLVMADPGSKGDKMGHRWMMEDSILSSLELTAGQIEKIRVLRESFQKDIIPLRTQKFERKAELRLLWMQMNLDPEKIKMYEFPRYRVPLDIFYKHCLTFCFFIIF